MILGTFKRFKANYLLRGRVDGRGPREATTSTQRHYLGIGSVGEQHEFLHRPLIFWFAACGLLMADIYMHLRVTSSGDNVGKHPTFGNIPGTRCFHTQVNISIQFQEEPVYGFIAS